ncbi:ribose-phosphate pyrophosphokinase [Acinetobacter calcoaceticus]|uniref:Ribose-phosphate pyrophosphokinase n=1 Tax=Acinetobacter calcoaceticus TaxID=471 RepID=A0A4R1XY34_ACICA|nr:ribose-phosphate pyrophosphokinase [Acinetobacter calcoaceticus]
MSIQLLDLQGQCIPVKFIEFSGGERHVQIEADTLQSLPNSVKVFAKIRHSADLLDYLLLENILLEQGLNIDVEMPYFPYARQDRRCAIGQAFSLDLMTRLLNSNVAQHDAQRRSISIWDAHSAVSTRLLKQNTQFNQVILRTPAQIMQCSPELIGLLADEDTVLICPDAGAIPRTQTIAQTFATSATQALAIVYCEKKRDPVTGRIIATQVNTSDLSGKTALITDDICDGGATFIAIAQQLRALNCQRIVLYVSHGIFSRGLAVFDGLIDQIFCSDSIAQQAHTKLTVIQASAMFNSADRNSPSNNPSSSPDNIPINSNDINDLNSVDNSSSNILNSTNNDNKGILL